MEYNLKHILAIISIIICNTNGQYKCFDGLKQCNIDIPYRRYLVADDEIQNFLGSSLGATTISWQNARTFCTQIVGTTLAMITSQEEQDFASDICEAEFDKGSAPSYAGFVDGVLAIRGRIANGVPRPRFWFWDSPNNMTWAETNYSAFPDGEPSSAWNRRGRANGAEEDCVMTYQPSDQLWIDAKCSGDVSSALATAVLCGNPDYDPARACLCDCGGCYGEGDPHVTTFDNLLFHPMDQCIYKYISSCSGDYSSSTGMPWEVYVRHRPCFREDRTCVDEVIVQFYNSNGDRTGVVAINSGLDVRTNNITGKELRRKEFLCTEDNFRIRSDQNPCDPNEPEIQWSTTGGHFQMFILLTDKKSGFREYFDARIIVSRDFGIPLGLGIQNEIGSGGFVQIHLAECWKDESCGICGKYDGDIINEFTLTDGRVFPTQDPTGEPTVTDISSLTHETYINQSNFIFDWLTPLEFRQKNDCNPGLPSNVTECYDATIPVCEEISCDCVIDPEWGLNLWPNICVIDLCALSDDLKGCDPNIFDSNDLLFNVQVTLECYETNGFGETEADRIELKDTWRKMVEDICKDHCRVPNDGPTRSPSLRPTPGPTVSPTAFPTRSPLTHNPTNSPTSTPTSAPSSSPTPPPSDDPTTTPTKSPSVPPTIPPTKYPTIPPTKSPTKFPSKIPTQSPTYSIPSFEYCLINVDTPTDSLTTVSWLMEDLTVESIPQSYQTNYFIYYNNLPSSNSPNAVAFKSQTSTIIDLKYNVTSDFIYVEATWNFDNIIFKSNQLCSIFSGETTTFSPTQHPINKPKYNPTVTPSKGPTLNPFKFPSMNPSIIPTKQPSLEPTTIPSNIPSHFPTKQPTLTPTKVPSTIPSNEPSNIPSHFPTKEPSLGPTKVPSILPTNYPSKNPSEVPSFHPTNVPSKSPTINPSLEPSYNPTDFPSETPSKDPTIIPTNYPLREPTTLPTISPTYKPSNKPTQNPSNAPKNEPTNYPSQIQTIDPSLHPSIVLTQHSTFIPTSDNSKSKTQDKNGQNTLYIAIIATLAAILVLFIGAVIYYHKHKSQNSKEIETNTSENLFPKTNVNTNSTHQLFKNTVTTGGNDLSAIEVMEIQNNNSKNEIIYEDAQYKENDMSQGIDNMETNSDALSSSEIIYDTYTIEGDKPTMNPQNLDYNNVTNWTNENVCYWIGNELNFSNYETLFKNHKITGEILLSMDKSDLTAMGITTVGDRIAIFEKIQKLKTHN